MTTEKQLTAAQFAYLALLMAEAREVSNTELTAKYGVSITGKDSTALVDNKLATLTKSGRVSVHELTDEGWAEAKKAMAAPYVKAQGAAPANAALHAVLAAVHRYLERADVSAADFFAPTEAPPAPVAEAKSAAGKSKAGKGTNVSLRISNAYKRLTKETGPRWLSLTLLRRGIDMKGISHEEVDTALLEMVTKKKIRLIPEENRKMITEADRSAAIYVSGEEKHLIGIGVA
ncbi:hypothetical protein [Catelliglobosispora koreensis]|uniref:hypothetical protein n=1 Tax=Catelliglobosispora koreensis TaxID=129052 RepID=UPI00036BC972|nr:hypothetical protein [Catelliglobosispora koreensis]